jgi:hypothetical protein
MKIKKNENLLRIGIFSLLFMILLRLINIEWPILDFFEGIFAGVSMVTNLCFLIRYSKEQKIKINKMRCIKN